MLKIIMLSRCRHLWRKKDSDSSLTLEVEKYSVGGIETGFLKVLAAVFLVATMWLPSMVMSATDRVPVSNEKLLFNIPSQKADKALVYFAEQAGVTFMIPFDELKGVTTKHLQGRYTPEQAIKILLEGTRLEPVFDRKKGVLTITVKKQHENRGKTAMKKRNLFSAISTALVTILAGNSHSTLAEESPSGRQSGIQEVIVTAEKREQRLNEVPMSITAASAEELQNAGVVEVRDLAKITPGFKYSDSLAGTPVYTLRGVGFDDIALAGRPTVSVYVDQAPIPFAIQTRGASLDLERVEVLKGPQGTLFGNNATGGLINYIAAKPTEEFAGGFEASLGNYSSNVVSGFISGPISDTLRARFAIKHDGMSEWQDSYTTSAENGKIDFLNSRLSLEWDASEDVSVYLAANYWNDRSDAQASYLLGTDPNQPAAAPLFQDVLNYPLPPKDNGSADFTPTQDYGKDNTYWSLSGRIDWQVTDDIQVTSLTTYNDYDGNQLYDTDGTRFINNELTQIGTLKTFSQELRASFALGDAGQVTAGVFYQDDEGRETNVDTMFYGTLSKLFIPFGGGDLNSFGFENNQDTTTKAVFASADYDLTEDFKIYGGVRYTEFEVDFSGCSRDTGDGTGAAGFTILANIFRSIAGLGPVPPVAPGECFTLDPTFTPGLVTNELNENNTSWRAGAQWQVTEDNLLYANVSKGYKAGGFPTILATVASQEIPANQEELLAYEVGFKSTLLDGAMQLNGAVFYYDYTDKQILGRVLDPVAGPITVLVNIPETEVIGTELQLTWIPVDGLTLNLAGSYIESEISADYEGADPNGVVRNFKGDPTPNTPELHLVGDIQYVFPVTDSVDGFVGINASHQSDTNGQLGQIPLLDIDSFTLVDLRAGVESAEGDWRAWAWVRNVTDEFYITSANRLVDTTTAYTGMPRTFGATVSYNF